MQKYLSPVKQPRGASRSRRVAKAEDATWRNRKMPRDATRASRAGPLQADTWQHGNQPRGPTGERNVEQLERNS
jgi:hypothetical protein